MAKNNILYKIKQSHYRFEQWMGRYSYIILFELILVFIFILAFINALKVLYASFDINKSAGDQLILAQTINSTLMVMLLLLISLGVLNIINSNSRLRGTLKTIEYTLSKRRSEQKPPQDD